MKKLLLLLYHFRRLALIAVSLILLSSCSQKPAEPVLDFSGVVKASCTDLSFTADIVSNSHDILRVKLKSPEALSGYTYLFKNGIVLMKKDNLRMKAEYGYIPKSSSLCEIYEVLSSVKRGEIELFNSDNSFSEFKGSCDAGEFVLTAETNTGAIRKIDVKGSKLEARFCSVKFT